MTINTALPDFNHLLMELVEEAHSALERSDMYDVHSENPASRKYFLLLERQYIESARQLVEYCAANRDALLDELDRLIPAILSTGDDDAAPGQP